jgi:hypothetical protein
MAPKARDWGNEASRIGHGLKQITLLYIRRVCFLCYLHYMHFTLSPNPNSSGTYTLGNERYRGAISTYHSPPQHTGPPSDTMTLSTLFLLVTAQLASAHFAVEYPEWRADSLTNDSYNQYTWPCKPLRPAQSNQSRIQTDPLYSSAGAGVPGNSGNRTDWPLTGGSLKLDLHHPWTYGMMSPRTGLAPFLQSSY